MWFGIVFGGVNVFDGYSVCVFVNDEDLGLFLYSDVG